MQKNYKITVYESRFPAFPDGEYSVSFFPGKHLQEQTCKKILQGNNAGGKYHYAVFKNAPRGFRISRKLRNISEQEQSWEGVADITEVNYGHKE